MTEVRVIGYLKAVLAQPARPDVVGVGGGREDTAAQDQRHHHDRQPGRRGQQRQQQGGDDRADRHDDRQVPQDRPAAPARVGELVPHPVEVFGRQPESGREPEPAPDARIAGQPGHYTASLTDPLRYLSWQMTAPAATVWPTWTLRPVTVPSLCAVSGCSIFMASSTTMVSPVLTCSPSAATIFTMVPCMGLTS